jgi:tRNA(Glu) U13 pseudouridine synthase TruD
MNIQSIKEELYLHATATSKENARKTRADFIVTLQKRCELCLMETFSSFLYVFSKEKIWEIFLMNKRCWETLVVEKIVNRTTETGRVMQFLPGG